MEKLKEIKKAGFWIRLLATWIDFLFIYAFLKLIFYSLLYSSNYIYFPFEFTFFIVGIIYSILAISFMGQTFGKYLVGITVYDATGTKLSFIQSLLRESILKILSGIVFLMGFLWIGFSKQKKGWHDYLCKSKVVQYENKKPSTI